ncbi:hypothetical protein DM860_001894 [Cuscuta australis]|uniref:Carotenoid oxygenase n=1 Tax=Cuscuta australis TaxID=267555 RepID=A0A328EBL6_9ASTE|nr:hypothetical protein DM860_001894 [Cuscuta australis]
MSRIFSQTGTSSSLLYSSSTSAATSARQPSLFFIDPFTKTGSQGGAAFTTVKTAVPPSLGKTHKLSSLLPRKATKNNNLPTKVLNLADEFIDAFIDPPLRSSVDPRHVLSSNFAPVDELPPTECEVVEGSLPSSLDGVYIRNGPNPQHPPRGPYHLFDGDGMLHAVRISGGKATFCSRYVRTYKFEVEREIGRPIFPNVFSGFITLGRHEFGGKLKTNMTAHPKIDPATGEAFAFRYGPVPPYLTFFKVSADGTKERDVPIYSVARPSFMHDFAITENYAIFTDTQIEMVANPLDLLLKAGGSPVRAVPEKVPRIGVIRRDAKEGSGMRWVDAPGFNNVHAINAWVNFRLNPAVFGGLERFPAKSGEIDGGHQLQCGRGIRATSKGPSIARFDEDLQNPQFWIQFRILGFFRVEKFRFEKLQAILDKMVWILLILVSRRRE